MTSTFPVQYTQTKTFNSVDRENVPEETSNGVRMGIELGDTSYILELLTNLYSNPEMSVVREYITNAVDAHTEAGQSLPVDVTLNSNEFVVQDYGTGMSEEDIKYIYSCYGFSTKRDDLSQIGGAGLGCKSALSIVSSFTVESVQDGKYTEAKIAKDDDGVGIITFGVRKKTTAPNGTKITIPIKDYSNFSRGFNSFNLGGFPSGAIRVNGVESLNFAEWGEAKTYLSGSVVTRPAIDYWNHQRAIVMGGVTYNIDINKITKIHPIKGLLSNVDVFFNVPIASVDLTPSREAIRYTERSVTLLESLADAFVTHLVSTFKSEMAACKNLREAIDIVGDFAKRVPSLSVLEKLGILEWNGTKIPASRFIYTEGVHPISITMDTYATSSDTSKQMVSLINSYYVDGIENFNIYKANFRKYLCHKYGEHTEKNNARVYFLTDRSANPTFMSYTVMPQAPSVDEVKAGASAWNKVLRERNTGTGTKSTTYKVAVYDKDEAKYNLVSMSVKELPKDVLVWQTSNSNNFNINALTKIFDALGVKDYLPVISLPASRKISTLEKRAGRNIELAVDYFTSQVEKNITDKYGENWIDYYGVAPWMEPEWVRNASEFGNLILDPEISALVKSSKNVSEMLRYISNICSKMPLAVRSKFNNNHHPKDESTDNLVSYISKKYPLLDGSYRLTKDSIDYINAMYLSADSRPDLSTDDSQ